MKTQKKIIFEKFFTFASLLSLCFLSFCFGVVVMKWRIFPYYYIEHMDAQIEELSASFVPPQMRQARYKVSGARIYDKKKVQEGLTFISTFWKDKNWSQGFRLIDLKGNQIYHWHLNPMTIWKDNPYVKKHIDFHGIYLFPNGDVLFNVGYAGLVRINSCGKVIFKSDYRTHHSMFRMKNGNFLVSGMEDVKKNSSRAKLYEKLRAPFTEDFVFTVSPKGKLLKKQSMLEVVYNSKHQKLIEGKTGDILHMNHVEILESNLIKSFPLFKKGDYLVSFRDINSIMVINSQNHIKWISVGKYTRQHDPNFEKNGFITVFNNRDDGTYNGRKLGGSRIESYNPFTKEDIILYQTNTGKVRFYSRYAGKHQLLKNNNRIIVEAGAGRVFEITPDGKVVWEWVNDTYDKKRIPEVVGATRYSYDYLKMSTWKKGKECLNDLASKI